MPILFLSFLNFYLFIYFWLCWVFTSVRGLSLVVASGGPSSSRCVGLSLSRSLVVEHRLQTRRLSSCGSRAQVLRGMWDPPRPGLEPVSPALTGRFSTTAPPGKPPFGFFYSCLFFPFLSPWNNSEQGCSAFHIGTVQTSEEKYHAPLCFSSLYCRGEIFCKCSFFYPEHFSRSRFTCSNSDSSFCKMPSHLWVIYTIFYPCSLSISIKIKEHSTDSHSHLNVLPFYHRNCSSW